MGYISQLAETAKKLPPRGQGQALWREVFGTHSTDKEAGLSQGIPPVVPGGSYGRSVTSGDLAFKRLLQAMRSMAPGGWSDDRWEQSRHFTGIQYVAIHRCAEQLSQAEFQVFEKDANHPDGKRPVTRLSNPQAYELVELLEKPNDDDSFGDLMYRWHQQMSLTGMALTWMVPNAFGRPYELYSVPTAIAVPQPAVNPDFPDGYYRIQPVYPYGPFSSYPTPASAVGAAVPAQWMLRVKYPHPILRYDGYSPLTALNRQIDQLEAVERSRWYQMKRVVNPSAVLNFDDVEGMEPLPEAEVDRIRAEFEATQQGPENAGQLFVATPGARLEPWGGRPVDMDYPSGWEQLSSFILGGGFGITKQAAGMIEDSSYSTLFATLKQLYWLTLEPIVNRIAAKLTRHLAPFFGPNLIITIRCKPINDHDIINSKIDKGMQGRCITKNEVRKLLDMPVTQDPWGDEIAGTDPMTAMGPDGLPLPAPVGAGIQGQPLAGTGQDGGVLGSLTGNPNATPEGSQVKGPSQRGMPEQQREEPLDVTASRPQPGKVGRGAKGPRKSLDVQTKSMYERVMEVVCNGH
jgi:HK97 family phage portal protein